jgi:hypothetical protein
LLVSSKLATLHTVSRVLADGALPSLSPGTADRLHRAVVGAPAQYPAEPVELQEEVAAELQELAVPTHELTDVSEAYDGLVVYLRDRRPREQLAQLRSQLEQLRAVLLAEFTVQDLLLEVGSKSFDRPGR